MPRRRMGTRTIKEILRLKSQNLSIRQISQSVGKSVGSIHKLLQKAEEAGLAWPLPEGIDDEQLEQLLYPPKIEKIVEGRRVVPDWAWVHKELKRKGVTRLLLWEEYKAQNPDNHYSYSRYCIFYDQWSKKHTRIYMRQIHKAGEKCFVDYAGHTVDIKDPVTGETAIEAQIFVGVMGASNYTYAEASESQSVENWLGSHTRMLEYFGGVPVLVVPDNLRSGVSKACRYQPEVNPSYQQWADHYGTSILPARPRKPRDKAKVETAVQIVERWILAKIRDENFFSVGELNRRISGLLEELNGTPMQKQEGSRKSVFEDVDRPELKPLPRSPYKYVEIKKAKVGFHYHVEYRKTMYSVPWKYLDKKVEVHVTENMVEIYLGSTLIAQHARVDRGGYVTVDKHMPEPHQYLGRWSPETLKDWSKRVGPEVHEWVASRLDERDHPQQAYRVCLGLLSLANKYPGSIEHVCRVANRNGIRKLARIENMCRNSKGKTPLFPEQDQEPYRLSQDHKNIRGAGQYR